MNYNNVYIEKISINNCNTSLVVYNDYNNFIEYSSYCKNDIYNNIQTSSIISNENLFAKNNIANKDNNNYEINKSIILSNDNITDQTKSKKSKNKKAKNQAKIIPVKFNNNLNVFIIKEDNKNFQNLTHNLFSPVLYLESKKSNIINFNINLISNYLQFYVNQNLIIDYNNCLITKIKNFSNKLISDFKDIDVKIITFYKDIYDNNTNLYKLYDNTSGTNFNIYDKFYINIIIIVFKPYIYIVKNSFNLDNNKLEQIIKNLSVTNLTKFIDESNMCDIELDYDMLKNSIYSNKITMDTIDYKCNEIYCIKEDIFENVIISLNNDNLILTLNIFSLCNQSFIKYEVDIKGILYEYNNSYNNFVNKINNKDNSKCNNIIKENNKSIDKISRKYSHLLNISKPSIIKYNIEYPYLCYYFNTNNDINYNDNININTDVINIKKVDIFNNSIIDLNLVCNSTDNLQYDSILKRSIESMVYNKGYMVIAETLVFNLNSLSKKLSVNIYLLNENIRYLTKNLEITFIYSDKTEPNKCMLLLIDDKRYVLSIPFENTGIYIIWLKLYINNIIIENIIYLEGQCNINSIALQNNMLFLYSMFYDIKCWQMCAAKSFNIEDVKLIKPYDSLVLTYNTLLKEKFDNNFDNENESTKEELIKNKDLNLQINKSNNILNNNINESNNLETKTINNCNNKLLHNNNDISKTSNMFDNLLIEFDNIVQKKIDKTFKIYHDIEAEFNSTKEKNNNTLKEITKILSNIALNSNNNKKAYESNNNNNNNLLLPKEENPNLASLLPAYNADFPTNPYFKVLQPSNFIYKNNINSKLNNIEISNLTISKDKSNTIDNDGKFYCSNEMPSFLSEYSKPFNSKAKTDDKIKQRKLSSNNNNNNSIKNSSSLLIKTNSSKIASNIKDNNKIIYNTNMQVQQKNKSSNKQNNITIKKVSNNNNNNNNSPNKKKKKKRKKEAKLN